MAIPVKRFAWWLLAYVLPVTIATLVVLEKLESRPTPPAVSIASDADSLKWLRVIPFRIAGDDSTARLWCAVFQTRSGEYGIGEPAAMSVPMGRDSILTQTLGGAYDLCEPGLRGQGFDLSPRRLTRPTTWQVGRSVRGPSA